MADHHGEARAGWKRRERLPCDVLGQDRPKPVFVRLMLARQILTSHGALPLFG
jgi:hypothetical protein